MTELINPANSPVNAAPLSAKDIAERQLGDFTWISSEMGYCQCPGRTSHSTNNGKRDCVLYLDHIPTLYCVHASCAAAIEEANRRLRSAILNPDNDEKYTPRRLTADEKAKIKERESRERIRQRAAKSLPELLADYAWPYDQIIDDSPAAIVGDGSGDWSFLLNQFQPDDVVWIGDKFDSGKPEHAAHFKTVSEWLEQTAAPGPFTCPVAFKNNIYARTNENILVRRFLVVESDTLDRDEVGAVFKWLCDKVGLNLSAVVDTAGKSLHGWFDYKDCEPMLEDLKLILPALECDPKLFTPSQPVRLPGAMRDGKRQKLVYLNVEEAGQ